MSTAATPEQFGSGFDPAGPPEGPGWESRAARLLPRLALGFALVVGAAWWVTASMPEGDAGAGEGATEAGEGEGEGAAAKRNRRAKRAKQRGRAAGCDCGADDCTDCASCAEVGCEGADCLSSLGDCGAADCGAADCGSCDCGALDCGSCDCGAVDCGGLDCGSCALSGVRGVRGVRLGGASAKGAALSAGQGASCPRRGRPWATLLALGAPLGLFALWRARSPRA